jgi:hypothetical protein
MATVILGFLKLVNICSSDFPLYDFVVLVLFSILSFLNGFLIFKIYFVVLSFNEVSRRSKGKIHVSDGTFLGRPISVV